MPFQPVDSRRLYEQVADQIGGLVRRGEFTAGQRLPAERDLAKMLAVSRPVVREAMIALEIGGLIEVRTGSGAFVREKPAERGETVNTGQSPSDILNARMLIEGEIAALAASSSTAEDLAAMAAEVDDMVRDHEAGRPWHAADLGFHLAIARATGQRRARERRRAPVAGTTRARLRPPVRTGASQRKLGGDAQRPQGDPRRDPQRKAKGRQGQHARTSASGAGGDDRRRE